MRLAKNIKIKLSIYIKINKKFGDYANNLT